MDIHRCRFVQYPPQPINALAFSHSSDPKKKSPGDLRLALGRNNGDVEIWNPSNGLWLQENILKGSKNTTIDQLAWTQELVVDEDSAANGNKFSYGPLRLFSTGGTTAIAEWDLCTGATKRKADGNSANIWCITPQPQLKGNKLPNTLSPGAGSQLLAAGCENGTILLFTTEDDDLRYVRTLLLSPSKKSKVLSLAWRDRDTLVAGYEDSKIRVIDVVDRRVIRNMSLGKVGDGVSIVWSIKCLPDGTVVSGDSSGELKIWDPKNLSLVQRLGSHKADVLDIAMSASGDTIFSVGVDRRTVTYKQVPIHSGTQKTRWAEISHKRYHQHDVKCAASFESKNLSVLVSGSMDTRPIVLPIRRSQTEYHRALPHLPQRSQISASRASRMFVSWRDHEIVVYHVRKFQTAQRGVDSEVPGVSNYDTLTRLVMQEENNMQDAQISEDGQFIVAATVNSVKLFQLRKTQISGRPSVRTRQIDLPHAIAHLGARRVGFSPDGKWLFCIRKDNAVVLSKIILSIDPKTPPTVHERVTKMYRQSRKRPSSALSSYEQTIIQTAFSSDGRVLAVGDLSGAIDVWILEGHEDPTFIDIPDSDDSSIDSSSASSSSSSDVDNASNSPIVHGQKWVRNPSGSSLPKLDSSILAITFRPALPSPITQAPSSMHDNLGLHPTRHTPHPVAQELPSSQSATLIAITGTHQLVEFDVLSATLSDWSRRNPSKYLPRDFSRIKDRVVGVFWDCSDVENKGERLWLYGSSWLFMLDLSKDFPQFDNSDFHTVGDVGKFGRLGRYAVLEPVTDGAVVTEEENTANRKQQGQKSLALTTPASPATDRSRKRKRNTGAGDEIRLSERDGGVGNLIRKFKNSAGEDAEMIDIDAENAHTGSVDGDGNMEIENEGEDTLALMRRGQEQIGETRLIDGNDADESTISAPAESKTRQRSWPHWHTFEYHSILGISVIGPPLPSTSTPSSTSLIPHPSDHEPSNEDSKDDADTTTRKEASVSSNIEVLIIERPLHDVDQVPRFDGGQEWDV